MKKYKEGKYPEADYENQELKMKNKALIFTKTWYTYISIHQIHTETKTLYKRAKRIWNKISNTNYK